MVRKIYNIQIQIFLKYHLQKCTLLSLQELKSQDIVSISTLSALIITALVLIDFSLTVRAATLIFISGRGSAISSAKEGKSGGKELISCLSCANVRAFHENPTVYTLNSHLFTLKAHNHILVVY